MGQSILLNTITHVLFYLQTNAFIDKNLTPTYICMYIYIYIYKYLKIKKKQTLTNRSNSSFIVSIVI